MESEKLEKRGREEEWEQKRRLYIDWQWRAHTALQRPYRGRTGGLNIVIIIVDLIISHITPHPSYITSHHIASHKASKTERQDRKTRSKERSNQIPNLHLPSLIGAVTLKNIG
jgi:hypothetical protein